MQKIQLIFPSQRLLHFYLTRKKIKNINLKITATAEVAVSAPSKTSLEFIKAWLISKEAWIFNNLARITANLKQAAQTEKISATQILILGQNKQLHFITAPQISLLNTPTALILQIPAAKQFKQTQILQQQLGKFALQTFLDILTEFIPLLQKHQLPYPHLKIRKMKARWGSCHLFSQTITLNSCLIHAPYECIRYVLCHELAHLKHFHHRKPFYDFLALLYPNWREQRQILNRHYKFILN